MIKNTIKTLALFVALAFTQATVIPAVYADDGVTQIQKINKENVQKEKAKEKEKQEREKAREAAKKAREAAREAAKKAREAAKSGLISKPITTPIATAPVITKPVTTAPAPVVTAPAPVVTAPVTTKPVTTTPAPVTTTPAPVTTAPAPVTTAPAPVTKTWALYNQYCAGCHGSGKQGKSAATTQSAINNNVGGMGYLSSLSSAQITALAAGQ